MIILYQSTSELPSKTANSVNVVNMCECLTKMGHEVNLLCLEGDSTIKQKISLYYGVNSLFNINLFKNGKSFIKVSYIIKSISLAKKIKPDLIISRFPIGAYIYLLFGYNVLIDAHSPIWKNSNSLVKNLLHKILYTLTFHKKNLLKITTNSVQLKHLFENLFLKPTCPIEVAFNGSEIKSLEHKYIDFSYGNFNIGYIGSFYKGRGIEVIIKLANSLPHFTFHLCGGTNYSSNELKIKNNNVKFYGYLPPADTYKFRNCCDVLIGPYQSSGVCVYGSNEDSSSYMNPIKVIEYMSSKKPIILSDLPALRDILNTNECLFAKPSCVIDWANKLEFIHNNYNEALKFADKSYEKFLNNFTWSVRCSLLIKKIEKNKT